MGGSGLPCLATLTGIGGSGGPRFLLVVLPYLLFPRFFINLLIKSITFWERLSDCLLIDPLAV